MAGFLETPAHSARLTGFKTRRLETVRLEYNDSYTAITATSHPTTERHETVLLYRYTLA